GQGRAPFLAQRPAAPKVFGLCGRARWRSRREPVRSVRLGFRKTRPQGSAGYHPGNYFTPRRGGAAPVRASCGSADPQSSGGRLSAVLALLSFAMLIVSLDQYIVVVALPDIGRDLGYSPQTLQSVVSAYAIASSGFLLFGGRASDLLGRRRILVLG